MRLTAVYLAVALSVGACASQSAAPQEPSPAPSGAVDPAAVARVHSDLPSGYEVAPLTDGTAPATFWGLKAGWVAQPPECGALADPGAGTPVRGWSASGSGGIIYVAVAGPGAPPAPPDGCAAWSASAGHTAVGVTAMAPPPIDGTPTAAMSAVATTTVEGGTQTRMHADTVTAYLSGGFAASVTVVTDPGSAQQILPADFAPHLLGQVVDAVTGGTRR